MSPCINDFWNRQFNIISIRRNLGKLIQIKECRDLQEQNFHLIILNCFFILFLGWWMLFIKISHLQKVFYEISCYNEQQNILIILQLSCMPGGRFCSCTCTSVLKSFSITYFNISNQLSNSHDSNIPLLREISSIGHKVETKHGDGKFLKPNNS